MKKLLLILTLVAVPAWAQEKPIKMQKEVWCADTESVFKVLTAGELQESSSWIGQDGETNVTLLQNSKTKAWTIVQFNQNIACILSSGKNSTFVKIEPNDNRLPNSKSNI